MTSQRGTSNGPLFALLAAAVLSVAAGGYQTLAAIKPEYPWQMLL